MDSRQRLQEGLQLYRAGDHAAAEAVYREVLTEDPKNADALHLMGVLATAVGQPQVAIQLIRSAIATKPNVANFHFSLGEANHKSGQLIEAMFAYKAAVDLNRDYAQALAGLGATLREQSRTAEAIEPLTRAIELKSNLVDAHYNLGVSLDAEGRSAEAVAILKNYVTHKPDDAHGYLILGIAQSKVGETAAAIASLQKAAELAPDNPEIRTRLIGTYFAGGKLEDAAAETRRAIEAAPQSPQLQLYLGKILLEQNKLDDAIAALRKTTDLLPNSAVAYTELGDAWLKFGRVDQAIENYEKAVAADASMNVARTRRLLALVYDARAKAEDVFAEHVSWAKQHVDPLLHQALPHDISKDPDRKLRIGYVSQHFCSHPIARLLTPILAAHNREQFEVFCYADIAKPDAITRQLQSMADHWRSILGQSDLAAAEMIRNDRIDVLIDLSGHTLNNRLAVFATKPAPVQITYLGYPHSTGMRAMDFRITDAAMDPTTPESLHTEQLIRLDVCSFAYLPSASSPDVIESPALASGHITFGSFAEFARVTPPLVNLWAEILKETPTSRLIAMADDRVSARKRLAAMFERQEIPEDRIEVVSRRSSADVFAFLNRIDILLDSFPCNGGLGTIDALWMGVPVITLAGGTPASRQGASLLTAAGLPDLIAKSTDDYAAVAYRVASDLPKLVRTREELREKIKASPLLDTAGLTLRLETAYRDAWKKWCGKT